MNWNALFIIILISAISILFRWISFNRVDSIALDFSISSVAYIIISHSTTIYAVPRTILGITIVIILSFIHNKYFSILLSNTNSLIDVLIAECDHEEDEDKIKGLQASKPLARHAIFLSYVAFIKNGIIRKGKKDASNNYAYLLSQIFGETNKCSKDDLSLTKKEQIIGLVFFNLLGLLSLLNATLECFFIYLN